MQKALLRSTLIPQAELKDAEATLDFTNRLILAEMLKDLPFAVVRQEFCERHNALCCVSLFGSL